jgi:outer membrane protein OmpA-like peptidoglycan-associated protein
MNGRRIYITAVIVLVQLSILFSSCHWNKTQRGAAIGSGVGAAAGAAIGSKSNHTVLGAIIGAAVGGTAGALIGNYMDKQAAELQRDLKDAKVERVGEGIKITFNSGILFDVDSYQLNSTSQTNLTELSKTLNKYGDTNILIEGHTDSTGTNQHNQTLSEKRSDAVGDFLRSNSVASSRITTKGYGEDQPVADNSTSAGRQQNRRVDIAIFANKKLKKAAEKGEIGAMK